MDVERDIDWENEEVGLPFDANNRQLNAKFSRKLVGQSVNDYTFKLDTDYDYIGTILVAASDSSREAGALEIEGGAPGGDKNTLRTLKFDQAFNEGAMGRFSNTWMAIGAMTMLLGW